MGRRRLLLPALLLTLIVTPSSAQTAKVELHSVNDQVKAIHPDDYFTAYRVIALYLAYLDSALD